jgi:hypothetical protein
MVPKVNYLESENGDWCKWEEVQAILKSIVNVLKYHEKTINELKNIQESYLKEMLYK